MELGQGRGKRRRKGEGEKEKGENTVVFGENGKMDVTHFDSGAKLWNGLCGL